MKRIALFLAALGMALTFTACSGSPAPVEDTPEPENPSVPESSSVPQETEPEESEDQPEDVAPQESKVLVVYFSATNTTKGIAELIAEGIQADLYEIVPAKPYTSADLNYGDNSSRTTIEMNDPDARPEITGAVEDMAQYDIVFLGYPIWWGEAPRIIDTFLESYDFSGKTIIPFCTSGSSGIGSSADNLHPLTEGADWRSGRRMNGASQEDIAEWIESLELFGE